MLPRDYILEQINHRSTKPVPYTIDFENDTITDRLDAHYGSSSWRDKIIPYIWGCGAVDTMKKFPVGENIEQDLFGAIWRKDKRPFHLEKPAITQPNFDNYQFPSYEKFIDPKMKQKVQAKKNASPDSFHIIWIPWGLWESSWGLRGFENALMDIAAEPDFFEELLDRLTDLFIDHVEQCKNLLVDAIMFGDDWGDQRGVTVGPERWRKLFKPRYARIYEEVHAQGKYIFSHCCGSVAEIMPDIIEIGLDVLESVQPEAEGMNPYGLKKKWGDKITFWGCLVSQSTIPFSTPELIRKEIKRLCDEMGRGGGYIIAPAKALQSETPTENAVAVLEAFINQL